MFDITSIAEALLALVGAVITCIVIPYIRSKTTREQQEQINAWVKIAVTAAEQLYVGSDRGQEKKEYVLQWLQSHGITLDSTELNVLIEAAVYELKNGALLLEGTQEVDDA